MAIPGIGDRWLDEKGGRKRRGFWAIVFPSQNKRSSSQEVENVVMFLVLGYFSKGETFNPGLPP